MQTNKLNGLLGLCKKSGNLIIGSEQVLSAIRAKKRAPELVLLAADASENTRKRIRNCCEFYKIKYQPLPLDAETLGHLIGKRGTVAVAGVLDRGFAEAISKLLPENEPESMDREHREDKE